MTLKDTIALLQAAPADPIIGISDRFQKDPRTEKVNLTVGNYLGPDGKIPLQATVHEAQRRLLERRTVHSYLPIEGLKSFCDAVDVLSFGRDSEVLLSGRSATCQAMEAPAGFISEASLQKRRSAFLMLRFRIQPGATILRFLRRQGSKSVSMLTTTRLRATSISKDF